MKFYLLTDPMKPGEFAQFAHVGTWSKGSLCESCGNGTEELVEPLQIEWDEGTERIGSFSWCSYTCVVTNDVRRFLAERRVECRFGRVEFVAPEKKKTRQPRVPFPYTGPHLQWLIPTRRVALNEAASGVTLVSDCPRCGTKRYTFKRDGLVIDAGKVGTASLFIIDQFGKSDATFVTEPLLAEMRSQGFTNLAPRLAGEIK